MGRCDRLPTAMMVVMPVPTMVAAEEVPRAPEAGVGITMTVGSVVVSLFVNSRGVVRARFDIDRCRLMVVVTLDDASALDYARRRSLDNDIALPIPIKVGWQEGRTTEGGLLKGLAAAWGGSINHVIRVENALQDKRLQAISWRALCSPNAKAPWLRTPSDSSTRLGLQERAIFPGVALYRRNGSNLMDETPNAKASKNAERDMKKAVDKVVDDKKKEPIGTKEAEEKVADDLMDAARKATNK